MPISLYLYLIFTTFLPAWTLPGPKTGLLSNTQKWIVRGDTCADKARHFIWKGHLSGEQKGKGTQENSFAMWLEVLGLMVTGLVSGLSLANRSDPESFLVDGSEKDSGKWSDMWHLLLTFPELFQLVVSYWFHVPYQDLMQIVTVVLGQGRQFQSVCFP